MLPLRDRVDLGAMAKKGYSTFPKAPALLELPHQIVQYHIQDTRWGGGSYPSREAVGVFYSPNRLGKYQPGNNNELDPASMCDCGRRFHGLRIHEACWSKQLNCLIGKCKSNDGVIDLDFSKAFRIPLVNDSAPEKFKVSQLSSGTKLTRKLFGQIFTKNFHLFFQPILRVSFDSWLLLLFFFCKWYMTEKMKKKNDQIDKEKNARSNVHNYINYRL